MHSEGTAWLSCITSLLVVLITPGSSVLLVVSQALRMGRRIALRTAAGDLTANALQILVVSFAAGAAAQAATRCGSWLKWCAVAFLVVTAVRHMRAGPGTRSPAGHASGAPFWTGFLVSISNPAAVLFFALWLPLFARRSDAVTVRLAILGAMALLMDGSVLLAYILASEKIGRSLRHLDSGVAAGRVSGLLRLVGAIVLATTV